MYPKGFVFINISTSSPDTSSQVFPQQSSGEEQGRSMTHLERWKIFDSEQFRFQYNPDLKTDLDPLTAYISLLLLITCNSPQTLL